MAYPDTLDDLKDDWKGKNLPEGELGDILTADSYNDHAKSTNAIQLELVLQRAGDGNKTRDGRHGNNTKFTAVGK